MKPPLACRGFSRRLLEADLSVPPAGSASQVFGCRMEKNGELEGKSRVKYAPKGLY